MSSPSLEPRLPFLGHLEELRKCLFRAAASVAAGFVVCFYYARPLFRFLEAPIRPYMPEDMPALVFTELAAPFISYLKVALFFGLIFASPVVLWQLWRFIAPGLHGPEKRVALPFVIGTVFFFLLGCSFGYLAAFPKLCEFFMSTGADFRPMLTVNAYLGLLMKIVLAMGLVFEIPMLSYLLARIGILTPGFLLHWWRHVVVGIFVVAAIITPTPDMVTQLLFALPMVLLYGLSIGIAWVFQKRTPEAT